MQIRQNSGMFCFVVGLKVEGMVEALKKEDTCTLPRVSFWGKRIILPDTYRQIWRLLEAKIPRPQGRYDVNNKAGEIEWEHKVSHPQGSEIQKLFDPKTQNSFDPNELKFVEIVEIIWWTYERIVFPYRSPSS